MPYNQMGGERKRMELETGKGLDKKETHEQSHKGLPEGYLKNGYFDSNGNLLPEFVLRTKVEPIVKDMAYAYPPLKNHQLRRFFQHCRLIETKLKATKESEREATWKLLRPMFWKLDAAASDAYRDNKEPKIPAIFYEFIKKNVAAVQTSVDFLNGFLPHFEALVGFGAMYIKSDERR